MTKINPAFLPRPINRRWKEIQAQAARAQEAITSTATISASTFKAKAEPIIPAVPTTKGKHGFAVPEADVAEFVATHSNPGKA
jgi:hypothetical protein